MRKANIDKRDEQIYKLREDGATFRHIGSLFNITGTRASQVYYWIKDRKDHFYTWPPLKQMLSYRAQKALKRRFEAEDILSDPKKIAETKGIEYLKLRNVGCKTIKEMARALHNLGCIKNIDAWLPRPYDELKSFYVRLPVNKKCPYRLSIIASCEVCGYRNIRKKCLRPNSKNK